MHKHVLNQRCFPNCEEELSQSLVKQRTCGVKMQLKVRPNLDQYLAFFGALTNLIWFFVKLGSKFVCLILCGDSKLHDIFEWDDASKFDDDMFMPCYVHACLWLVLFLFLFGFHMNLISLLFLTWVAHALVLINVPRSLTLFKRTKNITTLKHRWWYKISMVGHDRCDQC